MFATVDFALLGMTLVVVGWAIQFLYSWIRGARLSRTFVIFYGLGVLAFILEDVYIGSSFSTATWMHVITLLLVVLVLLRIQK